MKTHLSRFLAVVVFLLGITPVPQASAETVIVTGGDGPYYWHHRHYHHREWVYTNHHHHWRYW